MNRAIKTAFIIDTVMASGLAASVFLPSISIAIAFAASGLLFFIGPGFGVAAPGKSDVPLALQILGLPGALSWPSCRFYWQSKSLPGPHYDQKREAHVGRPVGIIEQSKISEKDLH